MISDEGMKKLYDQAMQGLEQQLMSSEGSNSSTIRENNSPEQMLEDGSKVQAGSSKARQTVDWEALPAGRSSGSSWPLRTGIGDRRDDDIEQE